MSKENHTDQHVDRLAGEFYKPYNSNGTYSHSVLQLRKTFKEHCAKPLAAEPKFRLDGPSVSWKVFKRLNQASAYADTFTKDCMVFSYEEKLPESSGQRLFLVTHPQYLWPNHKQRPLHERNTYEVIREDAPCKLYFDLEFHKTFNVHLDGILMTNTFIKCVIAAFFEDYNLELSFENFLWLDSSSDQKYSCHLILQVPGIAFENNVQAGYFVSKMLANIKKRIQSKGGSDSLWPSCEELESLFVKNADDRSVIFCDDGVYTKNRNFRLYLSTKFGKTTPLLISENNNYKPDVICGKSQSVLTKRKLRLVTERLYEAADELIFYDSLVTYFRSGKSFKKLLSCDEFAKGNNKPTCSLSSKLKSGFSAVPPSVGPSPYPEVDKFVSNLFKHMGGFVRKWSYLDSEEIIIYNIGGYRYCIRIGRQHKSNNMMIIVDMRRKIFYQKCLDPDCRASGWKSNGNLLPEHITSLYNIPEDFFEADCFSQLQNKPTTSADSSDDMMNFETNDNSNAHRISDEFLEDLSLDSYPFTQLCVQEPENGFKGVNPINHNVQNLSDSFSQLCAKIPKNRINGNRSDEVHTENLQDLEQFDPFSQLCDKEPENRTNGINSEEVDLQNQDFQDLSDPFTQLCAEQQPENRINENSLDQLGTEDLQYLETCDPFTQLCAQVPENSINENYLEEEVAKDDDVHDLERSFAADRSFDDLCMEDLESEFATQSVKDGLENVVNDHSNETLSENDNMKSNSDEMSSEDELMLAEAASAVEVSFSESMFSEETIF